MEEKLQELKTRLGEVKDLEAAANVLEWDQMTYMPPGGTAARAEQLATLRKTAHALFVSDETGRLLEELQAEAADLDYDSDEASLMRVTARDYERERKIPASLVAEMARVTALAQEAWVQARAESNYPHFQPHLQKVVDLNIQMAEALGYQDRMYDALLDLFEPEMKTAQIARVFDELKAELVPLVRAIAEKKDAVDDAILYRDYDEEKQWAFGLEVLRKTVDRLGEPVPVGHLLRYGTSLSEAELPVSRETRDAGLGYTAPSNLHHWVGYAAIGYLAPRSPQASRNPDAP